MKKRGLVKTISAFAMAGLFAMACGGLASADEELTISDGIFIGGIDVSGMTAKEASKAVQKRVEELGEATVTLMMGETPITATFNSLGLEWENKEIIDEVENLGTTGNIVQRYKDQKDLEHQNKEYEIEFTVDENKARSFVEGCSIYNSEPINGTVYTQDDGTPGVEGGTDGLTLRVEDSVDLMQTAFEEWTGGDITIDLAIDRVSPEITKEALSVVKDVLGSATTNYSSSGWERATNVENGCYKISGTLLMPGDYFSVTAAVTPFTADNGYQPAPSYEENRVVDSYGGGICQVSTTLYNAVLKAELEVTSRSNHTMIVTYVDPSKDAAIAEGVMDLAFVNTTEAPIYIVGSAYGGVLNFTIYGKETRPANRSIEFVSNVTSTTEPSGVKLTANTSQNVGYLQQTQSPHTGYTAELWKNIYVDGVLTDSVQINHSTYQAVGTAYDVGVVSGSQALTQAMYQAIATNDINQVQSVIANASSYTDSTEAPTEATEAPTPETTAPEVQEPVVEVTPTPDTTDPSAGTTDGTGDVVLVDPPEYGYEY